MKKLLAFVSVIVLVISLSFNAFALLDDSQLPSLPTGLNTYTLCYYDSSTTNYYIWSVTAQCWYDPAVPSFKYNSTMTFKRWELSTDGLSWTGYQTANTTSLSASNRTIIWSNGNIYNESGFTTLYRAADTAAWGETTETGTLPPLPNSDTTQFIVYEPADNKYYLFTAGSGSTFLYYKAADNAIRFMNSGATYDYYTTCNIVKYWWTADNTTWSSVGTSQTSGYLVDFDNFSDDAVVVYSSKTIYDGMQLVNVKYQIQNSLITAYELGVAAGATPPDETGDGLPAAEERAFFNSIIAWLQSIYNKVNTGFSDIASKLTNGFNDMVTWFTTISNKITTSYNSMNSWFQDIYDTLTELPENIAIELDKQLNPNSEYLSGSFGGHLSGSLQDQIPATQQITSIINGLNQTGSPLSINHDVTVAGHTFNVNINGNVIEPYREYIRGGIAGLFYVLLFIQLWRMISGIFHIGVNGAASAYMSDTSLADRIINERTKQWNTAEGRFGKSGVNEQMSLF